MDKRTQIREGIATRCFENCDGMSQEECDKYHKLHRADAYRYCGADQVLQYLDSQGCVLKVDRELPDWEADKEKMGDWLFSAL